MQQTLKYIVCVLLVSFTIAGCSSEPSLQRYFVDSQEKSNFISQDIPVSMFNMDESKLNDRQKTALNSIDRLNFLGFKLNEDNIETYNTELAKVKTILNSNRYTELVALNDRQGKLLVKYTGTNEEADEVILLGNSKEIGFAVVRILGDDMRPDRMYSLFEALQHSNIDQSQFKAITKFFK